MDMGTVTAGGEDEQCCSDDSACQGLCPCEGGCSTRALWSSGVCAATYKTSSPLSDSSEQCFPEWSFGNHWWVANDSCGVVARNWAVTTIIGLVYLVNQRDLRS